MMGRNGGGATTTVMVGDGRPSTTVPLGSRRSAGWPAFAGHDGACTGKRSKRWAAGIALLPLALLTGCEVGPNFLSPAAPAVSGYTPQPLPVSTAAASIHGGNAQRFVRNLDIPGDWWRLFHSKPLDRLVTHALQANPDIASAQAALREAQENLYAGQGAMFPSVGANVQAEREAVSGVALGLPGRSFTLNLTTAQVSVGYVPDVFGGTRRQIESLAAQTQYQRFQLEATYLTLSSNVVATAVQEASLRAQIATTEQTIKVETQALGLVRRQFEVGAAPNPTCCSSRRRWRRPAPRCRRWRSSWRRRATGWRG